MRSVLMPSVWTIAAVAQLAVLPLGAGLTTRQRQEIVRSITAEYGTAKVLIPRSKKPLDIVLGKEIDAETWGAALDKFGPAARLGDLMQVTKVEFKGARLVFELNHGLKGGRKWWHRVQIGGGARRGTTLGQGQATHAPGGTQIALVFDKEVPVKDAEEFLKMLKPILDFDQRSADELYMDTIDPKFREAIEKEEAIDGMDRDMVLLAKGRPDRKVRDFKEDIETEDWIYGKPPGDIVFVTFEDGEVIGVKHAHATLGGQVVDHRPVER